MPPVTWLRFISSFVLISLTLGITMMAVPAATTAPHQSLLQLPQQEQLLLTTSATNTTGKPIFNRDLLAPQSKDTAVSIKLNRGGGGDVLLGEIMVGTPPKRYMVDFDTGSSTTWLFGKYAKLTLNIARELAGGNVGHFSHTFYSATDSSSYSPWYGEDGRPAEMGIIYGDGDNVEGVFATETLYIGIQRIETGVVGIAETLKISSGVTEYDGMFGLGLTSDHKDVPSTLTQMAVNHVFGSNNLFSLYISSGNQHGELVLGGINRKRFYGHLKYSPRVPVAETPVVAEDGEQWVIALECESVVGHGLIDSGTNTIDAPGTVVRPLKAEIERHFGKMSQEAIGGLFYYDLNNGYTYDLTLLPKLKFTINGKNYALTGSEYFSVDQNRGFAFFMVDESLYPLWILGEPFLKVYYTVFDFGNDQIGFARARHKKKHYWKKRFLNWKCSRSKNTT